MHAAPVRHLPGFFRFFPTAVLLAAILIALAPAGPVLSCHRYYVWQESPSPYDGSSWNKAFHTLSEALSMAGPNDEIWVAKGVYRPAGSDRTSATFLLKTGLSIYGGFAGFETSRDQRNWLANPTILSGDIGVPGDPSDNSYHVVSSHLNSIGTAPYITTLSGFIIQDGNANGADMNGQGGGMVITGTAPVLGQLEFLRNQAVQGGGLYLGTGTKTSFDQVIFYGNHAEQDGGGIYANGANLTLTNGLFSGNSAGSRGGGLIQMTGQVNMTNVTFSGNSAEHGGAIAQIPTDPKPLLKNAILWGNHATVEPSVYDENNGTNPNEASYSIIEGGFPGTDILDQNPMFVRAPSPGGDGAWGTTDDDYGDLRLQIYSPGIDSGTDVDVPRVDLVGITRPQDGNGDGTAEYDMGAYEDDCPPLKVFLPLITK